MKNFPFELFKTYCLQNKLGFRIWDIEKLKFLYSINVPAVCRVFHDEHIESAHECRRSRFEQISRIDSDTSFQLFRCSHLFELALIPVVQEGEVQQVVFLSPVFFGKPDLREHDKIADKYGFSRKSYLKRVAELPRMDRSRFLAHVSFLSLLIRSFSDQKSLNSNFNPSSLVKQDQSFEIITDLHGNLIKADPNLEILTGTPLKDFYGFPLSDYLLPLSELSENYFDYPFSPVLMDFDTVYHDKVFGLFYQIRREERRIVWALSEIGFLGKQASVPQAEFGRFPDMMLVLDSNGTIDKVHYFEEKDPLNALLVSGQNIFYDVPQILEALSKKLSSALDKLVSEQRVKFYYRLSTNIYECFVFEGHRGEIMLLIRNVTRYESEIQRLRQILDLYENGLKRFRIFVFSYDLKNKQFIYESEDLTRFLEQTPKQFFENLELRVPAEDMVRLKTEIESLKTGKTDFALLTYRILMKRGSSVVRQWIQIRKEKSFYFLYSVLMDMSDEFLQEEALIKRSEFFKSLLFSYEKLLDQKSLDWEALADSFGKLLSLIRFYLYDRKKKVVIAEWQDPNFTSKFFKQADDFILKKMEFDKNFLEAGLIYGSFSDIDKDFPKKNQSDLSHLILLPQEDYVFVAYSDATERKWGLFETEEMTFFVKISLLIFGES